MTPLLEFLLQFFILYWYISPRTQILGIVITLCILQSIFFGLDFYLSMYQDIEIRPLNTLCTSREPKLDGK